METEEKTQQYDSTLHKLLEAAISLKIRHMKSQNRHDPAIIQYREAKKKYFEITQRMFDYYDRDYKHYQNTLAEKLDKISETSLLPPGCKLHMDLHIEHQAGLFFDLLFYRHCDFPCLCDTFLELKKVRSEKNIAFVKAMRSSQPGLFKILDASYEGHMLLENVLNRKRITIYDESLAYTRVHGRPDPLLYYMRIMEFEGIAFPIGILLQFPKNDPYITKWIKRNRNHNRPDEQLLELYYYYDAKIYPTLIQP